MYKFTLVKEQTDSDGDHVFLDNYIRKFVDNLLYEVGCKLIEEIADQMMEEDDDNDEDAT